MRTSLVLGLSTMLGAMGWMSACGSTESTCEERGDCTNPCDDPSYAASHPDVCPDAGTAGTGGDSSTGGSSGGSGEGGTAGASGTGGEAGTGGADAGDGGDADAGGQDGGDAEAEPYCDPTWMPEDDSCVVDDAYGVFVSPSGSDVVGCGGQSNPCATLGYGMLRAKAEDRRVYACGDGGTYAENLTVDASLDGVLVLGGFRCSDWSYEPATIRSRVEPSAGAALQVDGLSSGLQMRSFVFASADGSVAGESSIAGYVRDSQNVHFRDCVFEAGAGADGADGTAGDPGEAVPSVGDDQQGENGACGTMDPNGGGGWLADFVCAAGGSTRGGAGGSVDYEANGDDGKDGDPETNLQNSGMGLGGTGGTESIKGGRRRRAGLERQSGHERRRPRSHPERCHRQATILQTVKTARTATPAREAAAAAVAGPSSRVWDRAAELEAWAVAAGSRARRERAAERRSHWWRGRRP